MNNIIIALAPYISHYLPLMKTIEELRSRGYNIYFVIHDDPLLYKFINDRGFKALICEDKYNSHLNIRFSDVKNWQALYTKIRNTPNEFPYNLLNSEDHLNFENIGTEDIIDYKQILNSFNSLINDQELYTKIKGYINISKKSFCYKAIKLIDRATGFNQERTQNIKIFNHILLFEVLFSDYLKRPFYYKLYSNDFVLFRIFRRFCSALWLFNVRNETIWRNTGKILSLDQSSSIIKKLKPKLFISEQFTSGLLVMAKELQIPAIRIISVFSDEKSSSIPPFTTGYIPKNTIISKFIITILWFVNRLRYYHPIGFLATSSESKEIKRKLKRIQEKYKHLLKEGLSINYKDIPTLVLYLKELEFPIINHSVDINQCKYIGPQIFRQKQISSFNWPIMGNYGKLVYCSFGSVFNANDKCFTKFFNKLIYIFSVKGNYKLILSLGNRMQIGSLKNVPENVYIFEWVPQLEILEKADLMIHHGGGGCLNECICYNVPMLVYPYDWDQYGNSARIVYHELGLRGNIKTDSTKQIENKINIILTNPKYKNNIQKLNAAFRSYDNANLGAEFIDNYISKIQ